MNASFSRFLPAATASAWLVLAGAAHAQVQGLQRPTGIGGFTGGFGGFTAGSTGGAGSGTGNTSRQYLNSTMVGDAMITSDMETRRLIVVTDEDTNENIKKIVAELDKPKPQVLVNVIFVQVTHDDNIDIGTEIATYTNSNLAHSTRATLTTALGHPDPSLTDGLEITKSNLDATIHALAGVGKTEVLSRPSILTRSGQQASILVGQSVPFITNSRISDTTNDTINTVEYQDVGIILRVTPFITSDGTVEMIVSPEISSLSATTVPISNTVSSPVIDKRSADTVVVTPNDQTVVIGGLISNQNNDQDNKIPILGDIPILGYAFKRKVKSNQKTELLIFLTPHVVEHPEDLAKVSNQEQQKVDLIPRTFEQKDINRYTNPH